MRHGTDQPADRAARKASIGVERDDVANVLNGMNVLPGNIDERSAGRAAQQAVEFLKFSALAFPAHPLPFLLVPLAFAMKKKKAWAAAGRGSVALIQFGDGSHGGFEQLFVAGGGFGVGIGPVGQQSESQIAVGIGQVVNLQVVDIRLGAPGRSQQRWHDHNRAQ